MLRGGGLFLAVVGLTAATARALEGAPPFEWLVPGETLPESTAAASIRPDMGLGAAFAGGGAPEDSLKVRRYLAAPLTVRYALWDALEAYAVAPFYWGESSQHFVNYATGGAPEDYRSVLSGADFGDPALGARWRCWRGDEERGALIATLALVFPLGTNVWQNSQFNYVTSGSAKPDFAIGDGAYKLLAAIQGEWDGPVWRWEALGGYLFRFPLEASAIEPGASTITVHEPGSAMGWVRSSYKLTEDTWLTGRVDGFWSAGGSFAVDGLLARDPAVLNVVLDSYRNLIRAAGGVWAGVGVRQAFNETWEGAIGILAPLAVHGMYRVIRLEAAVSWSWKP